MDIRSHRPADRAALIALWQACKLVVPGANDPDADIDFCVQSQDADILVGTLGGRLVASAMVGHDGHRGWLYYVAVAPDRRRQGLGRVLVAAAETWLKERGVPKVHLMVRETNQAVAAFYQGIGYDPMPRINMQKWLKP